jgi:hypothetical protein
MDVLNIDVALSQMLLCEMGTIAELQREAQDGKSFQALSNRAQTLAALAQTIAALNHAGVTSIDRSVVDEVLARAKLEGLLS